MADSRAAEFLQLARELEGRDLELAARIDGVSTLLRDVDALKARATSVSLGTSPGHASPSARARANSTGRLASETTLRA